MVQFIHRKHLRSHFQHAEKLFRVSFFTLLVDGTRWLSRFWVKPQSVNSYVGRCYLLTDYSVCVLRTNKSSTQRPYAACSQ